MAELVKIVEPFFGSSGGPSSVLLQFSSRFLSCEGTSTPTKRSGGAEERSEHVRM